MTVQTAVAPLHDYLFGTFDDTHQSEVRLRWRPAIPQQLRQHDAIDVVRVFVVHGDVPEVVDLDRDRPIAHGNPISERNLPEPRNRVVHRAAHLDRARQRGRLLQRFLQRLVARARRRRGNEGRQHHVGDETLLHDHICSPNSSL